MSFATCLAVILQSEGGYSNVADDPGGATNLGVTIGTLSHWEGRPATVAEVKALTPETVGPIYQAAYWNATGCNWCPAGVDLLVFDMAVNQGPRRAIEALQTALHVPADGLIGPTTRTAAMGASALPAIEAIRAIREAEYRALPTFPHFGTGWLNRLERTAALARQMATNIH